MSMWHGLARIVRALLRRNELDHKLDAELRFHLECEIQKNLDRGMNPAKARREALLKFGSIEASRQQTRETWGGSLLETAWQDIRYGARVLLKKPGFTIVAIIALALGIGANAAVFSVLSSVILKPLPFKDPDRIMNIGEVNPAGGSTAPRFSPANFIELERRQESFESVSTFLFGAVSHATNGEKESWPAFLVTGGFFPTFGVAPLAGRVFTTEDLAVGAPATTVLSYRLWQRRFAGDPKILGQTLTLDRTAYTVIGIMPESFRSPGATDIADLWITLSTNNPQFQDRVDRYLQVYGRLKSGVTQTQAQSEMSLLASRLAQDFPASNKGWEIKTTELAETITGDIRPTLLILFAAGFCVWLIACANVSNLLLARASVRKLELGIRAALGASRSRLIRQVLTESGLLSLVGGILGVALTWWAIRTVKELKPDGLPRIDQLALDWRALLFTLTASILAGCACGAISGWLSTRIDTAAALKDSGAQTAGSIRQARARNGLIVIELALTLVLLVSAGLLTRSLYRLTHQDAGFNPHGVFTALAAVSFQKFPTAAEQSRFYEQFITQVRHIPGVESAALVTAAPLASVTISFPFSVKGSSAAGNAAVRVAVDSISTDFFKTLGIGLKMGRDITEDDKFGNHGVALINETLAHRYFGSNDRAIGREIEITYVGKPITAEIVGVVGDTKRDDLAEAMQPSIYLPESQVPWRTATVVARTNSTPMNLAKPILQALRTFDNNQNLYSPQTMDEAIAKLVTQPRFYALLFGSFALVAIVLASVGLYGVISYMTGQRTHEIGIRVALGAQRSDVVKLVLSQGMTLVAIGVILGLGGALAASRLLSKLLYGVSTVDLISYLSVSVLLGLVALLACYIPARRATKVDPLVALRYD